jgi:signal transduction histidine kinase
MPKEINEEIWKTIMSGGVWQGELFNRKKNGDLYWEDAVISPIINENGIITNFVAVKEDITEKKKLWNELITAKEKAEESDRLKSAFLANISHEIRTPMNGILGFAELLKEPELTGDEQSEYIGLIQQSGERMLGLINDLIDISRIEAGETFLQISVTPVNTVLHNLHAFFRPQTDKKKLLLRCSPGLSDSESLVETDRIKIGQVMTNLIQNALKFTRTGEIAFGYEKTGDSLEFFVTDTGIGIPAEMKDKIFDRFRQLDNSLTRNHEGSGLGLCISKAYIDMLGGTISVESAEGRGSTFRFTIPYKHKTSQSDPGSLKSAQEEMVLKPSSALTIVIAEDDETSRLLLATSLQGENITVLTARNGQESVDLVRHHPETDLVLMDIRMPKMNGFDATRLIKKIRPGLPVIAQTAFTSEDERKKAKLAGCDGFLSKPVRKKELLGMIKKLFGR